MAINLAGRQNLCYFVTSNKQYEDNKKTLNKENQIYTIFKNQEKRISTLYYENIFKNI